MGSIFADFDSSSVALALGLAMFAGWAFGLWLGRRLRIGEGEVTVSKFEDGSLALMGLLLAFTFSMAIAKHDQRRLMVVADSNSIGDFYTCASLLKEPVRTELRTVTRDYTKLRADLGGKRVDDATFESALRQMQVMQNQMTALVYQAITAGTPIAVSLTNALNGVTSSHATRLAAVRDRLPATIVWLLLVSAVGSSMLVGREQGRSDKPDVAGTICFIVLVSFAVYVTMDLNQPDRGLITVSQEPMQHLLSSMTQ